MRIREYYACSLWIKQGFRTDISVTKKAKDVEVDENPGRSITSKADSNVQKEKKIVMDHHSITSREFANDVDISNSHISSKYIDKVCLGNNLTSFRTEMMEHAFVRRYPWHSMLDFQGCEPVASTEDIYTTSLTVSSWKTFEL